MIVWRICKERHASTAFSGEGARLYSARWNPAGVPMVYTATSLALAAVEVFVHLQTLDLPRDLVAVPAELPVTLEQCERLKLADLPSDWKREKHLALRQLGAEWATSLRSLALMVPSAAVNGDWNVLINPLHKEATAIKVGRYEPFQFDERMLKR
jgi:RES domain-containing protein